MTQRGDAWLALTRVVAAIEAELGKVLQERHGLGLSDYRALDILSRSPNSELRMQDLAAHLGLNQSSVSRMVERLERSGLTIRDLCPDDKRGVYTVLTDEGRARLDSARPAYDTALAAALKTHDGEALLSARLNGKS
ncbi:MarR family winged helix-turn-helix transcriptional regulator [Pleomorphomonas oryzae]|uniref:MarR family winged helix-turn-helix transcriptional regulator n=1 Tax=Pleomorphomonas oryzae TaxID=261934 RepID=UPI0003FA652E|nr:MarR family transcriptional regulator [Pleomorphomonas oryzae]